MNEPVRALIVDDEPLARETVRLLLSRRPDVEIVGECGDGEAAVAAIHEHGPDLVFLDVQMPALDGFGVIRTVGTAAMPVVVFVTAYDRYALRAFEAQALDYLLKPFDDERFADAVARAVARVRERERTADRPNDRIEDRLAALLAGLPASTPAYAERIMVRSGDAVVFVPVDSIRWIEAAGDYVVLHAPPAGRRAPEGVRPPEKQHLVRETMQGMLEKLDPRRFVRIHRSAIVRTDAVVRLQAGLHGDYLARLDDGTELRVSRRYWPDVERVLAGGRGLRP